jgi:very-short-patch-repair endonuclease
MRNFPTDAKHRIWSLLRNRRFADFKFRRQVPIGPYIADFACFSAKLIIELDCGQHADSLADAARDQDLSARGFRILRIWNNDLTHHEHSVLDAVWNALQEETQP